MSGGGRDQPLGVAVVGLGIGEQHARRLAGLDRVCLRALLDHDAAKARRLADQLGALTVPPDYEALLGDPQVEAVVIASYDDDHAAQTLAALQAGKHVFVEKPLCRTLDELRAIKAAWAGHGGRLKLSSNLILRAAPLYRWLKTQCESGRLGRIYSVDGEYLYGRLEKITAGWRAHVEGYSAMLGGGIHLIDLMLWLTGERPATVYAAGNRLSTEGTAFRYQDFIAATFEFPSTMVGRIVANFGCVHPHQHVLRLYGTGATFLVDDAGPRWHESRDPAQGASPLTLDPLPAHKGDLLPEFVLAILSGRDWDAHTQAHLDTISVCVAADHALATNAPVKVTYI